MSGYMPAQALLKTLLLTVSGFSAGDVVESDPKVLDQGRLQVVNLEHGGIPQFDVAGLQRVHAWEALADLLVRFRTDADTTRHGTLRDAIVAKLDATKDLSADYYISMIQTDGDPERLKHPSAGEYIIQTLRITIVERV
jgi:hypothetical protein